MKSCVPCLQVYLLLLTWGLTYGSGDITCTATTDLTQSTVTCYFHDDLSKVKNNFNVQFYFPPKTTNPDQQLACNWLLTGPTQCSESQGVQFNNNVTDQLTFTAPPMVDKVGGEYMCHVLTRDDVTVHPCTLIFTGGVRTVTEADTGAEDSSNSYGQVQTLATTAVIVSVIALGLILALLVFRLLKNKSRICNRARYETKRSNDTEPEEIQVLNETPRENEAIILLHGHGARASTHERPSQITSPAQEQPSRATTPFMYTPADRTEREPGKSMHASPLPASSLGPLGVNTVIPEQRTKDIALDNTSTEEQRILIIGKTKSGKSSLANAITDSQHFHIDHTSFMSREPTAVSVKRFDTALKVVDAPDLSQISAMADKRSQVAKWKKMTSPGPSAILLAIRSDIKFRKADYDAYEEVKTLWGDDSSFCERLFVVFTYAEYILPNIENKKWESYPELDKVLVDANYRHAIISNKASAEEKEDAVKRILLNVAEIEVGEASKRGQRDTAPLDSQTGQPRVILPSAGDPGGGRKSSASKPSARGAADIRRAKSSRY